MQGEGGLGKFGFLTTENVFPNTIMQRLKLARRLVYVKTVDGKTVASEISAILLLH